MDPPGGDVRKVAEGDIHRLGRHILRPRDDRVLTFLCLGKNR